MREYKKVDYKKIPLWKDVPEKDWYDYKWQLAHVIRDIKTLEKVAVITSQEKKELQNYLPQKKLKEV